MAVSLYDLSVTNYLQTLGAVEGFVAKSLSHFQDNKVDANEVADVRLARRHAAVPLPDPFDGAPFAGRDPRRARPACSRRRRPCRRLDIAGLQKQVTEAREELQKLKPDEVDGLAGKDIVFQMPTKKLPFTAEGFLLSFSLPNFYFHATTAYDILRSKGVPLGKRDFLGRLRMKS